MTRRSTTGVVNVYDANELSSTVRTSIDASEGLFAGASPRPIRELMNLTTEITNIAFNHDAQMMAISSSKKKDAFRMVSLVVDREGNKPRLTDAYRSVPPAIGYGFHKLAHLVDTARGGHVFRLFRRERVCRYGQHSRQDLVVQR